VEEIGKNSNRSTRVEKMGFNFSPFLPLEKINEKKGKNCKGKN